MESSKKLKIAMVAPSFGQEGGPEVVCKQLTIAFLKKGVDVTLFAPADWKTGAKHIPTLPKSLWRMQNFKKQTDVFRKNLIFSSQLEVIKYQRDFDIIHLHAHRSAYTVARFINKPCILTLHNVIDNMEFQQIKSVGIFPVAISQGRKGKLKTAAVVENGIDVKKIKYSFDKGKYLIFVGRIMENKGVDLAIKIAQKSRKKLIIVGRIGDAPERQLYFKKKIKPYLSKTIILKDQMPQSKIYQHIKNAEALLFPMRGKLTLFPLVVMEALACGTPVIGTEIHSITKKINRKNIGCLSNNLKDLVGAASHAENFDRFACRKYAEKHFDSSVMAEKYIELYNKIICEYKRKE